MVSPKSAILLFAAAVSSVAAVNVVVSASGGNASSPTQYGLMHEDINYSGEGGVYAELIRNRAFQGSDLYPSSLASWSPVNGAILSLKNLSIPLSKALPTSMNVARGSLSGKTGFANSGFYGISVKKQKYTGVFWVKGDYKGSFTASLQSGLTGETFGSVEIESMSSNTEWTEHAIEITPTKDAPSSNNTFSITFDPAGAKDGSLDFNFISLFPPTFKNRPNGLRPDLLELLADLKPTFFRLPGGNMLEGNNNKSRWDWKDSIGPLIERPGFPGVWGYEQTNGLGLMEYLLWAEDLDTLPILAVWDGLALNGDITPEDKLQPFIDDAMDEIEFVTGSVDTKYGALRASLGHPKPFTLKWVEVGNEDWLAGRPAGWESYKQYRFKKFFDAIHAKYPHIEVISSGAITDGFAIPPPAAGDYHTYTEPDTLVGQFGFFDQFNATQRTLVGEIAAVHPNGGIGWNGNLMPLPWWGGSVGEAIFLMGLERNSDRIIGATYAPMLRSLDSWSWSVTLIQHAADPALTTTSTSYWIWKLLGNHIMTHTLPTNSDFNPLYYVAGKNEKTGSHIFKAAVYNSTNGADVPVSVKFEGLKPGTKAELTILTGPENVYGVNMPLKADVVATSVQTVTADSEGAFKFNMPNMSFGVLDTGKRSCKGPARKRKL